MNAKKAHYLRALAYLMIALLIAGLFALDLILGSADIALAQLWDVLLGRSDDEAVRYILLHMRLPKAIAAILTGAGMAVTGLQMQTLFRNPLADTSILGIGGGASLGVALYVLAGSALSGVLSISLGNSYWAMIGAAMIGAILVLLAITWAASKLRHMLSVLIIGVMMGFLASSAVNLLQYFADPNVVKSYLIWSFGSLQAVSWQQLYLLIPIVLIGLLLSSFLPKQMNAMLMGDGFARSVGLNLKRTQLYIILLTSLIVGSLTAFVGPIAFIGIAVPHLSRLIFRSTDHRILIPACIGIGAFIMLACDVLSILPGSGVVLPINAVTSVLGAPVVIYIIIRNRKLSAS